MVVLGRLTAPHGVKGWLKLHPFGDDPDSWRSMKRWWLGADEQDFSGWRAYPLQFLRLQGKSWVVKLVGVEDRNGAEALIGQFVGAPRADLPATGENEFYWADLIGLAVVNELQEPLGRVTELLESGANTVVVVTEGEGQEAKQRLIPFVGQTVKQVDVPAGVMRVVWHKDW